MDSFMMWWIDTPKLSLTKNIEKAMNYYKNKYGCDPDLCLVRPSMLGAMKEGDEAPAIVVRPYRAVLPGHLWIGIEEKS